MQPGTMENLSGIDITDTGNVFLIHQKQLQLTAAPPEELLKERKGELFRERFYPELERQLSAVYGKRSQASFIVETHYPAFKHQKGAQVLRVNLPQVSCPAQTTGHAQVNSHHRATIKLKKDILSAPS
jgi:predicted phosphohydrolase